MGVMPYFLHSKMCYRTSVSRVVVFALMPVLIGCSSAPSIEPDRTTYPRELVREEHLIIPIPAAVHSGLNVAVGDSFSHRRVTDAESQIEVNETMVGDRAEHEIRVVPKPGQNKSEAALRSEIPQLGKQLCGEHYRVVTSKYYLGTEGASAMLGIGYPWLRATIRCPLQIDTRTDPLAGLVADASLGVLEAEYFDIHEKDFMLDDGQLLASLRTAVALRGWAITEQNAKGGVRLVTDRYRGGMIGSPMYEQLIAVVAPRPGGSTLAFRLVLHSRDFEGGSDATGAIRLTPMRRDAAYREASKFLGELNAQ